MNTSKHLGQSISLGLLLAVSCLGVMMVMVSHSANLP